MPLGQLSNGIDCPLLFIASTGLGSLSKAINYMPADSFLHWPHNRARQASTVCRSITMMQSHFIERHCPRIMYAGLVCSNNAIGQCHKLLTNLVNPQNNSYSTMPDIWGKELVCAVW